MSLFSLASLLTAFVFAPFLSADTIWISSGGTNALELKNVQVVGVTEGKLLFRSADRGSSRELVQVSRLQLDDEPSLSAGEDAFAAGKFDVAGDAYRKALTGTTKEWVKTWSARRLLDAGQKAGRFDAAATGYITLLIADPKLADGKMPAMPDEKSAYLNTAIAEVNSALANSKLTDEQKQGLQGFLLEMQRVRKDQKGATQTMEQMLQSGAALGSDTANAALAQLKLQQASAALDARDYAKAIGEINANRRTFIAPKDQAQALFILAGVQEGLALAKNEASALQAALQDAGLAYMRVVAHFKDVPQAPYVAQSLLKAAMIEEKLNDRDAAIALYEQIVQQYPAELPVAAAKTAVERLQARP